MTDDRLDIITDVLNIVGESLFNKFNETCAIQPKMDNNMRINIIINLCLRVFEIGCGDLARDQTSYNNMRDHLIRELKLSKFDPPRSAKLND